MVNCILWDNDGVLVDTEELFFESTRETLARFGVELQRDDFVNLVMRQGRNVFNASADRMGWRPEQVEAMRRERDVLYAARLKRESRAIAGAAAVLEALRGRARMAVVTTSLREHFEIAHRHTGFTEFFELVVAREDYEKSKPAPEPYLTAMARMSADPARSVAIEDSERGLAAAIAAGLRCLIVPNALTRGSAFRGAAAVLDDIAAVPTAVAAL